MIRNLCVKKLARGRIERISFSWIFIFITTTRKHWNGKYLEIFLRHFLKSITMKKFASIFLFFFNSQSWSLNSMGLKRNFNTHIRINGFND